MQLKPNSLLQRGKYRIEKVLGQGGFGITYQAVQVALNRKVAIKEFFMKEYCNRDEETSQVSIGSEGSKKLVGKFRAKFIKEAQTIAELENNHIIRIYDIFEENGTAYYVMEFLAGSDLRGRIPEEGMPEQEALGYIRQIADALSYIHARNILHLDVKPANILLRPNGEAVLIDFGLAKHYEDDGGGQTSSTPVGISEGYAPTEQYDREGVSSFSASTDVYALGGTLFCMLKGERPPKASIVLNKGLPELPPSISANTRQAVKNAMQPRRDDRPQSIGDFLDILDNGIEEKTEQEDEETVIIQDTDKKKQKNTGSSTLEQTEAKAKRKSSIIPSVLKTRNWFVNMVLFLALGLVACVGGGTSILVENDVIGYSYTALMAVGIGVGIIAVMMNRRWGFYLMLLAASAGCLMLDWTIGRFHAASVAFFWYIPIWIVIGLVLLMRKDKKSAWAMLTVNNLFRYRLLKVCSLLLLIASCISHILFPVYLSDRNCDDFFDVLDANRIAEKYVRANYGYAEEQCHWGMYRCKNDTEAFEWIMKSANNGYPYAQLLIAQCYKEGKGVERSRQEAIKWFRTAYYGSLNSSEYSTTREEALAGLGFYGVEP